MLNTSNRHDADRLSYVNSLYFDHKDLLQSIEHKCELLNYLVSDSKLWLPDYDRQNFNMITINKLILLILDQLDLMNNEYYYLKATQLLDKILIRLNRDKDAVALYNYPTHRFHYFLPLAD